MAGEDRKDDVIDPLALVACGRIQNYRVTARSNGAVFESRPNAKLDTSWSEDWFEVLHADTDEEFHFEWNDHPIYGLNQKEASAFVFSYEDGVKARILGIEMVNAGKIRAPKRNWDDKFGHEREVTITHEDGSEASYTLPAGLPIEELKAKYPELYNTSTSTRATGKPIEPMDTSGLLGGTSSTTEEVEEVEEVEESPHL